MNKIFGIGFHKTGTSTLDQALTILGYKVGGPHTNLAKFLFENNLDEIWKIADQFDALQDNPWPLLYKELDKKYPNSKFVLTLRDEGKWLKSLVNHFGETDTEMRRWIYGVGHPKGNENIYLERYKNFNKEVLDYFKNRQDDFICLSWENGDNWQKLCPFLNKQIPKIDFPHANKGRYTKVGKMMKNIKKKVYKYLKK